MSDIKPFTPAEAKAQKVFALPPELIKAVNELLAERYVDRGVIHIKLIDLKARCRKIILAENLQMSSITDPLASWDQSVWDFEPVYRQHGWKVSYDSPAYNESYDGYYIFEKKD